MKLSVNGEQKDWPEDVNNLIDILKQLGYEGRSIAIAVNQEFVPKKDYPNTVIQEGDDLEIVTPIQGGSHVAD